MVSLMLDMKDTMDHESLQIPEKDFLDIMSLICGKYGHDVGYVYTAESTFPYCVTCNINF